MQKYSIQEMLLCLSQNYEERGIRDIIFNQMFEIQLKDLLFHLPQLAVLFNRKRNEHIIKLINYFSTKNQIFQFLVNLYYLIIFILI